MKTPNDSLSNNLILQSFSKDGKLYDSSGELLRLDPKLSVAERWTKILSTPFALALFAVWIQWKVGSMTVSKDYVALSTEILRESKSDNTPRALRNWAVDVLDYHSDVDLSEALKNELKEGKVSLPSAQNVPELISELARALKDAEIMAGAALMHVPLSPRSNSKAIEILSKLEKSEDPAIRKTAKEAIKTLSEPISISISD